jgi:hypothetical protein
MLYVRVKALERLLWPACCACCGTTEEPLVAHKEEIRSKHHLITYEVITTTGYIEFPVCEPCRRHIERNENVKQTAALLAMALLIGGMLLTALYAINHNVLDHPLSRIPLLSAYVDEIEIAIGVLLFLGTFVTGAILIPLKARHFYHKITSSCKTEGSPVKIINWETEIYGYDHHYYPWTGTFVLEFLNPAKFGNYIGPFVSLNSSAGNIVQETEDYSQVED